ncbi:MAG: MerR family transcriptional regulator [Actinomycetota bacterium]|nr:MerR family transcriptional regulator [Actinomycetota bacterium]
MSAVADRLRSRIEHAADGGSLPALSEELVQCLELPADVGSDLSIASVSALTGVTAHTLRYYERIGLVSVARDGGGRRSYDRDALGRVVFLTRLRMSDMPIRDIRRYVDLVERGDSTVPERLALLRTHRAAIQSRLEELQWAQAVVDYKITTYGGDCAPES